MAALPARHGFDSVEIPHPAQGGPTQDPTDNRGRHALCDVLAAQTLAVSAMILFTQSSLVGQRSRCGDERSASPAAPSALNRASHLRAVRRQTPAARATTSGVRPPLLPGEQDAEYATHVARIVAVANVSCPRRPTIR
jgi:hypothetical protein